jgi:hypothetical protein
MSLPRVTCDTCGTRADACHLLPWVTNVERVSFTCPDHDDGGYWFSLDRIWPSDGYGIVRHIAESKRGGYHALALMFERLEAFARADEARFRAKISAKYGDGLVAIPLTEYVALDDDGDADG